VHIHTYLCGGLTVANLGLEQCVPTFLPWRNP